MLNKFRDKSRDVKTPNTLVSKRSIQIKYSLTLFSILQEAIHATKDNSPVNKTKGAEKPSTPTKYEDFILKESIHLK